MPVSNTEKEFVSYLVDLMQSIGPVCAKGMFGGHGIFLDELMLGLIADSVLYLKADREIIAKFEKKALDAFTYNRQGKEFKMSYYQAAEETLEDAGEMNIWANRAYAVALRATARKKRNE